VICFTNAREAKEFMVGRIVEQARRDGIPLSEVERKMLYFSETGWAPPDIISTMERFECECDTSDYERKIARLIRAALDRADQQEYDAWIDAIRELDKEDHYLGVMVDQAGATVSEVRPRGDRLKLWGGGVAIVVGFLCVVFLTDRLGLKLDVLFWIIVCCVVVAYLVLWAVLGQQRVQELLERFAGFFNHPK
jgi:hypothetical protein